MLLKIYPENPNVKSIQKILEVLEQGGVIIYPTDTVYGIGCDILNQKAIERVARLKGTRVEKSDFSFIFSDLSHISEYTQHIDNNTFKVLKEYLPGPYTFILQANNKIPRIFRHKKKTIGIRIPDNPIILTIVREFGRPILTTSVHDDDEIIEYTTDPELIHEKYGDQVDLVIDGGFGANIPSTIVDCSAEEHVILRQGAGEIE